MWGIFGLLYFNVKDPSIIFLDPSRTFFDINQLYILNLGIKIHNITTYTTPRHHPSTISVYADLTDSGGGDLDRF